MPKSSVQHQEMAALAADVTHSLRYLHKTLNSKSPALPEEFAFPSLLRAALLGLEPWLCAQGVVIRVRNYQSDPLGYFFDWWRLLGNVQPYLYPEWIPSAEEASAYFRGCN